MWAYDANDLLAVKNGQMQPWQIQPYATWYFDFPQFDGAKYIEGVDFDPATSRLYVTESGGDTQAPYSYLPVVQVYQLTLSEYVPRRSKQAARPCNLPSDHSVWHPATRAAQRWQ